MNRRTGCALGAVALALGMASGASGATLTVNLNTEFSGGVNPQGTAPWATAVFDDSVGGANTVRLTMSASNLVATEFISEWSFNFDPALNPGWLTFTSVNTGVDSFKADGDGFFDIRFDFPPPPGNFGAKFTTGEQVIYDLTYSGSPIFAASFNFPSANGGGAGTYVSAAHVQGISGTGSGWIGPVVPEPTSLILIGSLAGLGLIARRRRG